MANHKWRTMFYVAQFFFGGWFLLHGLNHWLEFFPRPSGSSPVSRELIGALNHSGLFAIVKVVEIITGLMLLANRGTALAAMVALPVTLSIAHLNIVANADGFGIMVGMLALALNGLILLGQLDKFVPLLSLTPAEPSLEGLTMLRARQEQAAETGAVLRPTAHLAAIVAGLLAPYAVTLLSTMDGSFRSQASYDAVARASSAQTDSAE
jgi:hypothetical protein